MTIRSHTPNPGPRIAYNLGLPYLAVALNGDTHVTRNAGDYVAATGRNPQ